MRSRVVPSASVHSPASKLHPQDDRAGPQASQAMACLQPVDLKELVNGDASLQANMLLAKRVLQDLRQTSCLVVKDPRVPFEKNKAFLDLMEDYFDRPEQDKLADVRPDRHFQVRHDLCASVQLLVRHLESVVAHMAHLVWQSPTPRHLYRLAPLHQEQKSRKPSRAHPCNSGCSRMPKGTRLLSPGRLM